MKRFISLLVAVIIIGIALGILLGSQEAPVPEGKGLEDIPQLSLQGFSRVSISLLEQSILLTSGCRQLSMVTTQEQIYSIAMGIEGRIGIRPLSHDLFGSMAGEFGIEVLMVKVESLKDGTYYAKLLLRQDNIILNMDSRPSDAIAVAVRTGSPVYVENRLMENYSADIC